MPRFRRYYLSNSPIFITCVTHNRIPYLQGDENLRLFWEVLKNVQQIHPFHLQSYVIMPNHFHWIMELPENEVNFSTVMHSVKNNFTRLLKQKMGVPNPVSHPVWQKRFWDHIIRDDDDFQMHFDYIHWNPVKHGYARKPEDWEQSSFRFWCEKGAYPAQWGWQGAPEAIKELEIE
jgi:putative transposase